MGFSRFFQSVSRRKQAKHFFLSNGALLLEKQITFGSVNNTDPIKIFTAKEIQLALTNQMLSKGFYGSLYKGFLDDQIVAIRHYSEHRSSFRDEELIDEILNMVVIQSQISHRNIVKIIGCCLETPIPTVVYEFVPNGSLSNHIFGNQTAPLSWVQRLSVATQIAEALCYLHIAGSRCIIHRGLKPESILLDEHFNPKIADFELSITTTVDQRTVAVNPNYGTLFYSAPEYWLTGKSTEMIDVYAFGVILLEILSGEKVSRIYTDENAFLNDEGQPSIVDETWVRAILEKANLEGVEMGQLKAAAELVVRCMRREGEERPSMKEVVQEMHKIIKRKDDCC